MASGEQREKLIASFKEEAIQLTRELVLTLGPKALTIDKQLKSLFSNTKDISKDVKYNIGRTYCMPIFAEYSAKELFNHIHSTGPTNNLVRTFLVIMTAYALHRKDNSSNFYFYSEDIDLGTRFFSERALNHYDYWREVKNAGLEKWVLQNEEVLLADLHITQGSEDRRQRFIKALQDTINYLKKGDFSENVKKPGTTSLAPFVFIESDILARLFPVIYKSLMLEFLDEIKELKNLSKGTPIEYDFEYLFREYYSKIM